MKIKSWLSSKKHLRILITLAAIVAVYLLNLLILDISRKKKDIFTKPTIQHYQPGDTVILKFDSPHYLDFYREEYRIVIDTLPMPVVIQGYSKFNGMYSILIPLQKNISIMENVYPINIKPLK